MLHLLIIFPLCVLLTVFACAKSKDGVSSRKKSTPEISSLPRADSLRPSSNPDRHSPVVPASQQPAQSSGPPSTDTTQKSDEKKEDVSTQKSEEKKEDTSPPLDASLPAVEHLLTTQDPVNEEWIRSLLTVIDKAAYYQWATKKRLAADINSWKEVGRKIHKFHSDGFTNKNVQDDPQFVMNADDNKKKNYRKASLRKDNKK